MARNAHPEVTRQRILDAARTLFARQGYERTSIQDIINELGDLSIEELLDVVAELVAF